MSNTQISDRIPLETGIIQHHSPHKSIKQYIQATCMPSIIVEMSWRNEEEENWDMVQIWAINSGHTLGAHYRLYKHE